MHLIELIMNNSSLMHTFYLRFFELVVPKPTILVNLQKMNKGLSVPLLKVHIKKP